MILTQKANAHTAKAGNARKMIAEMENELTILRITADMEERTASQFESVAHRLENTK